MQDESESFETFVKAQIENDTKKEKEDAKISDEITWLELIKDVLDELNQKRILKLLDTIMKTADLESTRHSRQRASYSRYTDDFIEDKVSGVNVSTGDYAQVELRGQRSTPLNFSAGDYAQVLMETLDDEIEGSRFMDDVMSSINISTGDYAQVELKGQRTDTVNLSVGDHPMLRVEDRAGSKKNLNPSYKVRPVWGARGDPEDLSLAIASVNASISDVNGMAQRAKKAYQSVSGALTLQIESINS
jgi:uncharacterized protein YaaR (DUF327 family)